MSCVEHPTKNCYFELTLPFLPKSASKWFPLQVERTGVAMRDARLKILSGPASGQMILIPTGKLIIGREDDCHLRSPSEFVSRHHCVLLLDEYTLRIRDLGSKNGTFINGRRLGTGVTILLDGDIVSVGEMVCQIDLTSVAIPVTPAVPDARPATSPQSLAGTGVFEDDTVRAENPRVVSPPPAASPHARGHKEGRRPLSPDRSL
jgi:predicted component of type VI protein secretion system